MTLDEAMDAYLKKFRSLPTLIGINAKPEKMAKMLSSAVESKNPLSDKDWYQALGLTPPPSGALS